MGLLEKLEKYRLMSQENKAEDPENLPESEVTKKTEKSIPAVSSNIVLDADPASNPGDTETRKAKSSSKPKYSLQFKMMTVISIVIAITVSVIIALATTFFKKDYRIKIQESNLELVRVVNSKVLTDLLAQIDKAKQLALTLKQEFKSDAQKQFFIDQYFKNDDSFIYLAVYKKEGEEIKVVDQVYNHEFLKKVSLSDEDIAQTIEKNLSYFSKSFTGQPTILNTSPGFQEASIGLSIPAAEGENSELIMVILIRLEKILDAFKKSGPTTTYMVNGEGMVLAHSDMSYVLSGKNMMTTPIVRSMLTSLVNNGNGQERFEDTDGKIYLGSYKKLGFANAGVISVVDEDFAYKGVYEIQKNNILIMIISLCVSLIIVYLFARTISIPVLNLLDETIKISRGIFKLDIKRTTNDEVGVLTDYFKSMAVGLEEREKVKNMLGSMIDPVVVAEGMKDLAALKRGDEKNITAFFSDVAGFSSISEKLNSVQLAGLLNEYLSAMTIILKSQEGVLDKYIGDAIVGIFNAPVEVQHHSLKAARASLEMLKKLKELREYWTKNNLYVAEVHDLHIRIGLNSGLAKVGFMGTDDLASYTMMGDTVNLAARLEAAGKDYGVSILITESVKKEIEQEMFCRFLDRVRVKGKYEPIQIYELVCYNSEVTEAQKKSADLYNRAFDLYLKQDWINAMSAFSEVTYLSESAIAAEMLIDRCVYYSGLGPGKDWDGVFTRTHK